MDTPRFLERMNISFILERGKIGYRLKEFVCGIFGNEDRRESRTTNITEIDMYQFVRILMDILQFWELYAILYYLNFHNGLGLNFKINLFEATLFPSQRGKFYVSSRLFSDPMVHQRDARNRTNAPPRIKGKLEAERERRGVKRRTRPIARKRNLRSRHTASAR